MGISANAASSEDCEVTLGLFLVGFRYLVENYTFQKKMNEHSVGINYKIILIDFSLI